MPEEEQNRLLAKSITDYNKAVRDLTSVRARLGELERGAMALSDKLRGALDGVAAMAAGGTTSPTYPTKDEVDGMLRNLKDAESRVTQLAEQVRNIGGAPDLSVADKLLKRP